MTAPDRSVLLSVRFRLMEPIPDCLVELFTPESESGDLLGSVHNLIPLFGFPSTEESWNREIKSLLNFAFKKLVKEKWLSQDLPKEMACADVMWDARKEQSCQTGQIK